MPSRKIRRWLQSLQSRGYILPKDLKPETLEDLSPEQRYYKLGLEQTRQVERKISATRGQITRQKQREIQDYPKESEMVLEGLKQRLQGLYTEFWESQKKQKSRDVWVDYSLLEWLETQLQDAMQDSEGNHKARPEFRARKVEIFQQALDSVRDGLSYGQNEYAKMIQNRAADVTSAIDQIITDSTSAEIGTHGRQLLSILDMRPLSPEARDANDEYIDVDEDMQLYDEDGEMF